jgi:putative restriction endonuclease
MIGTADFEIRSRVFDWLTRQRDDFGEAIPRTALMNFSLDNRRIPLMGPSGIWKPAACELPISISTTIGGPYDDSFDREAGTLLYAYRGTDPSHRDNRGLRRAMAEHVPLVYFHAVEPGSYVAAYPVFIVEDQPARLRFSLQVDDVNAVALPTIDELAVGEDPEPRRAYVTATFRRRLHQVAFRQRVIRAYAERCALCRLRHQELLDAAHITPDSDLDGEPVVSNGVALCKLHHAAFDRFFFAIRPDYVIEVRPSILMESDGPMLVVGLQQIHGQRIHLPRRSVEAPDRGRLERRYEQFRELVSKPGDAVI